MRQIRGGHRCRRASVGQMTVRRRWPTVGAVLLAVAACSPSGEQGRSQPSDGTTTAPAPSPSDPSPSPSESTVSTAAFTQPLAFAFDIHRPALDLTTAQARAIVAGTPTTWRDLGQPGGTVRVRTGAAQLSAAETDPQALVVVPAGALRPTVQVARVGGVDPLRDPRALSRDCGCDGGRPACHDGFRGGRPHVRATRRRNDERRGDVAAVAPAARLGRHHGRKPREHPVRRRAAATGRRLVRSRARGTVGSRCGPASTCCPLANNHTGDFGPRAFRATLNAFDGSSVRRVGAGLDDSEAWRPVVVAADGVRFGFVAFNAIGESPRATTQSTRGRGGAHAATHRTARPRRPPPVDLDHPRPRASGGRRRGAAALGHAVHEPAGARPAPGGAAPWSTPAPTSSSAAIPMSYKGSSCAGSTWCCTRSATSCSTWTSHARPRRA